MTTDADFRALVARMFTLHERGHYQEAIAVVRAAATQFPDRAERTTKRFQTLMLSILLILRV